jgi:hypothetical protein
MRLTLRKVRIAFPHLFTPQASLEEGGTPKYNANFLIAKGSENERLIKEAVLAAATEQWKGNAAKVLGALETSKKCLRDGDKNLDDSGEVRKGYEDHVFVVASNKARPTVVNKDKTPLVEGDGVIYGGCYVNALVDVYPMDKDKIRGVFAELRGVQFVADGERLGGSAPASLDEFDDVEDDGEDPLAGFL